MLSRKFIGIAVRHTGAVENYLCALVYVSTKLRKCDLPCRVVGKA